TPLGYVAACLVALGLGFAFFSAPNTNAVMSSVEKPVYSVASAILSTMRLVGHVLSMDVLMLILAWHLGHERMRPAVYPQFLACMQTAFPILAVLCLLGILASLARGDVDRKKQN
ncbi:MAG: MFS transporter, partial [Planctomycetota bacterium]